MQNHHRIQNKRSVSHNYLRPALTCAALLGFLNSACSTTSTPGDNLGGSSNLVGPRGRDGKDGKPGLDGKDAVDGQNGTDGVDGTNGKDGQDGLNGVDGTNGKDGTNGLNGTDGTNGVDGSEGTDGVNGTNGTDGTNGLNGTNGVDGQNGTDGTDGVDGQNGTDGLNGTDGKDGADGANGADGQNGTDGVNGENGHNGEDGHDGTTPGPIAVFGITPPALALTVAPAEFSFACSVGDCEYEYSLDGNSFGAAKSPLRFSRLPAGDHRLRIRAKNANPADIQGFGEATSYEWRARKPNILTILADDLGYSDLGVLGSEISTPHIDELARTGRILANHQMGTVCAVTRSMFISGTDHHKVGEGTMGPPNDERSSLPGYEGYLNDRSLSIAELLQDAGYHTYISGKWHLGSRLPGATTGAGKTPDQWGFERSFSILGGGVGNHFMHVPANNTTFTLDGVYSRPGVVGHPAEGKHSADYLTDKLIEFIDHGLTTDPDKPFFAYGAYLSPHWPLQAPEPWLSKYRGVYDGGYKPIAEARLRRLKDRGVIPSTANPPTGFAEALTRTPASAADGAANAKYTSAVHSPVDGYIDHPPGAVIKNWENLTLLERKAQARYMEIYAAMVDHLDYNIGRLVDHLKEIGEYEYTVIMFSSDHGAEGWPIDSGVDPKATDENNASASVYPTLGTDQGTANARNLKYGIRWGEVSATPASQVKSFQGIGGLIAPTIIHLPGQTEGLPPVRHFTHVTDLTATFADIADVQLPSEPAPPLIQNGTDINQGKVLYDQRTVFPITGLSLWDHLNEALPDPVHQTPFGGETYGRAFLLSADGKWRIRWTEPPYGPADGHWELFFVERDWGETQDLSSLYPDKVSTLYTQWTQYMTSVGGVEPLKPRGFY